jgi:hypothetical protein
MRVASKDVILSELRLGMIWNSKLYPWQPYRTFDSLDKAVSYALEIDGYRKLWMVILWAEQNGVLFST